eukprot:15721667-Heterocapsa_arctica.AAC.1
MADPLETLTNACDSSGEDADNPRTLPRSAKDLRKRSSVDPLATQLAPQWPAHIIVRALPSRELTCGGCGALALFNDLLAACYLQSPLLTCVVSAFHVLDLPPAW